MVLLVSVKLSASGPKELKLLLSELETDELTPTDDATDDADETALDALLRDDATELTAALEELPPPPPTPTLDDELALLTELRELVGALLPPPPPPADVDELDDELERGVTATPS